MQNAKAEKEEKRTGCYRHTQMQKDLIIEKLTLGGLRKAVVDGDVIHGSVMAGQIAGLVKDSRSCKEIIEGICREMKNVVLSQAENIGR